MSTHTYSTLNSSGDSAAARRGFTLVELLVVVAIVAVLLAILIPGLRSSMRQARRVVCASNLRQLGFGLHMYAADYNGKMMPLAYTDVSPLRDEVPIFWWGTNAGKHVDHTRGFMWPYLSSELRTDGLFECPEQGWGSYVPQGDARAVTSTYGYNGYFLSPAKTPGWRHRIGGRRWQNLDHIRDPQRLFAFADAMLVRFDGVLKNTALLDPPQLYQSSGRWFGNGSPTTSFRHDSRTNALHVDGHVMARTVSGGRMTSTEQQVGSVGAANDPHYVPDWRDW